MGGTLGSMERMIACWAASKKPREAKPAMAAIHRIRPNWHQAGTLWVTSALLVLICIVANSGAHK
jgi:hypothetical protein